MDHSVVRFLNTSINQSSPSRASREGRASARGGPCPKRSSARPSPAKRRPSHSKTRGRVKKASRWQDSRVGEDEAYPCDSFETDHYDWGMKFPEATDEQIHAACESATAAFDEILALSGQRRRGLLHDLMIATAAGLIDRRAEVAAVCQEETGYLPARVDGEIDRAAMQLRLFAALAQTEGWQERQYAAASPGATPPQPAMTRRRVPIGPVAVFGACNFPIAISVIGNDTVAAWVSGNPVIVKSHPGHPRTCDVLGQIAAAAVQSTGLPAGMFGLLHGARPEASIALVEHPGIAAVGFTGSPAGGRALAEAALRRTRPIPVYAELGSPNPVFLTPAALAQRHESIADGFTASLLFGNGQMCTKPALLIAVDDAATDAFVAAAVEKLNAAEPLPLLTDSVARGFDDGVGWLRDHASTTELTAVRVAEGRKRAAVWLQTDLPGADEMDLWTGETFGPVSVIVRVRDPDQMLAAAGRCEGSLTTTVHAVSAQEPWVGRFRAAAERFAGRVIFNGWPTGMTIGPATQHGGPFPASLDGRSTSVGFASVERFVRPVCFQGWPVG